jgi:hypothetical protein
VTAVRGCPVVHRATTISIHAERYAERHPERTTERSSGHRAGKLALRYSPAAALALAENANSRHRFGRDFNYSGARTHAPLRKPGNALQKIPCSRSGSGFRVLASVHYFVHLVLAQPGHRGDEHHKLRRPVDPARDRALWLRHCARQFDARRFARTGGHGATPGRGLRRRLHHRRPSRAVLRRQTRPRDTGAKNRQANLRVSYRSGKGAPLIYVSPDADAEELKRKHAEMQAALERVRDVAESWFGLSETERERLRPQLNAGT